jgi:hypothetical protein
MSIASDLRGYADNAVSQGKQVLDQAQAQLNDVTGQATELYGKTRENVVGLATKATGAVTDLRLQAEKAVNLDAIKTAVEPYVAQVKGYGTTVTDRVESIVAGVKSDKRVAALVDTAQERVIKPVKELTGLGGKPVATATTPAKAATKPAATKPASKPAASKPASKPAARKAPARRTTS